MGIMYADNDTCVQVHLRLGYHLGRDMVRLAKFLAVGASGTIISISLLWIFTDLAGWHYLASYALSFIVAVSSNYLFNSLWAFNDKKASIKGWIRYIATSLFTFGIRELGIFLLTELAGVWYLASAVVMVGASCLVNFALSRRYVWNMQKA